MFTTNVRTPEYFPFNFHLSFKNIFKSVDSFWNFNTNLNFLYEKSQIPNFLSSFFFLSITFEQRENTLKEE